MSMSKSEGKGRTPVIRDEGFARRLETACEANPNCPTEQYRGKQKWVYDNLLEKFDIKVSPEAVRRWFAGEMRPRLKTMSALAQLLEVDLGWLTLGTKPEMTPKERKARNAVADGAVNLVAGIVQMNGGSVAFPTDGNHGPDLYAIIGGKQDKNAIRRIYNRAEHWDDRVRMMQWWADYLDKKAEQP